MQRNASRGTESSATNPCFIRGHDLCVSDSCFAVVCAPSAPNVLVEPYLCFLLDLASQRPRPFRRGELVLEILARVGKHSALPAIVSDHRIRTSELGTVSLAFLVKVSPASARP